MSLDNSFRAYGRFLVTFNRLNPLLDAAIVREAHTEPLSAATRKRNTLAFARRAGRRLIGLIDPDAEALI